MQDKLQQVYSYLFYNKMHLLKIAFTCLVFFIISYFVIQNKLTELRHQIQSNFTVIEKYIESEISNANHIIYSLTVTLLHDFQLKDTNRIQEIIDIFDPRLKHLQFPPFSGLKVLGANNELVAISAMSTLHFIRDAVETDPSYLKYIENIKKNPFSLYVAPIRLSRERHLRIIPMGMAMVNSDKEYVGVVLTGILTDKLTERLNNLSSSLKDVKLYNLNDTHDFFNHIDFKFTFLYLMKHVIEDKPVTIIHSLANYPFIVKAIVNSDILNQALTKTIFFCIEYFLLFSVFAYLLWSANRKLYSQSLKKLESKLNELPGIHASKIFKIDFDKELTPKDLTNIITNIIDTYHDIYLKYNNGKLQETTNEVESKVLQLILTERHYYPANRNCHSHSISELYINQLKSFINETDSNYYLANFLKEVVEYCSEYYYELNIELIPVENDRAFSFKRVALCETIFNIFALILRVGEFNVDAEQVIVRGFFNNLNNNFPTITIEASIIDSDIQALGCNSGVSYIYSGLYTIYELAKQNKLSFYVEQEKDRIFFILEPISEERFIAAENCVLKYILNKT